MAKHALMPSQPSELIVAHAKTQVHGPSCIAGSSQPRLPAMPWGRPCQLLYLRCAFLASLQSTNHSWRYDAADCAGTQGLWPVQSILIHTLDGPGQTSACRARQLTSGHAAGHRQPMDLRLAAGGAAGGHGPVPGPCSCVHAVRRQAGARQPQRRPAGLSGAAAGSCRCHPTWGSSRCSAWHPFKLLQATFTVSGPPVSAPSSTAQHVELAALGSLHLPAGLLLSDRIVQQAAATSFHWAACIQA